MQQVENTRFLLAVEMTDSSDTTFYETIKNEMSLKGGRDMLRSLKSLFNYVLTAEDGKIGRCKDFLFDDRLWIIR